MLEVRTIEVDDTVLAYVEKNRHRLTPDFSSYANKRMRAWIGAEAPLSDKQDFRPAAFGFDSPLYRWLHEVCTGWLDFVPEVALLHVGGADCSDPEDAPLEGNGGQCGIKLHRDAGYGDWRAVGINLCGTATFGYRCEYQSVSRYTKERGSKLIHVPMTRGTCVIFNCKNPHFAQVGPNRWCINAWRISDKRRKDFELYKRSAHAGQAR